MVLFLRMGAPIIGIDAELSGTGQEAEGVAAYVAVLPVAAVRGLHLNPGFDGKPCGARRRGKSGRRTTRSKER
ncbi:hypothetical protein GCM10010869_15190 [Mesorhizobium tianshanense]|nr:hypothetical protein GCM10010869_15190 [Mesorhizobium tianshanense]